MDAILNNPFRILGLPTTASDKEIAKRVSDLLIYVEMGKRVSYETDFPFLGEIDRSIESIKHAAQKIEIPENRIFYSLLWFDLKCLDKESIEFLKQGDFIAVLKILNIEYENNSPVVYRSFSGQNVNNLLKKFKIVDNNDYSIQKVTPPPTKSIVESTFEMFKDHKNIITRHNERFIDIPEAYTEINFKDKYQLACQFKWIWALTSDGQEVSIDLGFINCSSAKHFIRISNKGVIKYFNTNHLEIEKEIDKAIFNEKKFNFLSFQRYDNYLEIKLNDNSIFKIETHESFQSTFLCFSGRQNVLIEHLFLTGLERNGLGENIEMNNTIFSYSKNISLLYLLKTLQNKKIEGYLLSYFEIIGDLFKQPYFITYTKEVISKNYLCNFEKLTDIFVREFYLSLNHLVDSNEQYSQFSFYNSFKRLSDEAEKKIKDFSLGSKPHIFDNYIKDTAEKRIKEPQKSFDLACDLKNESTYFSNWYSQFYGSHSFELKSISDRIGTEIIECSISYYNSTNPKGIELARQTLKLLTWASDFAFNQQIRDRINENISVLLKRYEIIDYKIIDFDEKDRTRDLGPFSVRGNKKNIESSKTQNIETKKTPIKEAVTSKTQIEPERPKNNTKQNQPKNKLKVKSGLVKKIFLAIFLFVYKYFILIVLAGVVLYLTFQNSNIEPSKWKGNTLVNGASPYDSYFREGIYDYNSKCWIAFKNGNSTDAIACLVNIYSGTTIRNEYIRAGTDYTMSNLPAGVYKIKVFYGNDWNPEKTLNQGSIKGAFDTDFSFSLSDKSDDLIHINITETNEGIRYTTGETTLYTVSHGNMQQRKINSDEFFK